MCVTIPHIFCVRIDGVHHAMMATSYYGLAFDIAQALKLAVAEAERDGWSDIEVEQITDYGEIAFSDYDEETEVTPCNP